MSPRLNIRFIRSIISICQAHGQDIHALEEIEPEADGFANDVYLLKASQQFAIRGQCL